jgi:hypothetical protein
MSHRLLAEIALATHLLARHTAARGPLLNGRAWERVVGQLLCRPGLESRQYAGITTLFGMNSSSHCAHELDAAVEGWRGTVIIEAKSKAAGISKADVAVFGMKTFDYYRGQLPAAAGAPWWRLITSAGFVADNLRRLCLQEGILLCDPVHLPIPVLLHIASQPVADQFLDDVKLVEFVRLGERACESMHDRWKLEWDGTLSFRAHQWRRNEMDDLLWLQEDLTSDVLVLYDTHRPGRLETRIEQLVARLHMAAYA